MCHTVETVLYECHAYRDSIFCLIKVSRLWECIDSECDLMNAWKWMHEDRMLVHTAHDRFIEDKVIFHAFIFCGVGEAFLLDTSHVDDVTFYECLFIECMRKSIPLSPVFFWKIQSLWRYEGERDIRKIAK